ncbi:MAG: ammonium transporter [Elainellaceae cyanobacterium]
MDRSPIDILWILISASLVFLMQAGFLCLEAGSTRSKNNINVVIKNIADLGFSVLCFWLFGYGLMFGRTYGGWVGTAAFAPEVGQSEVWTAAFFLFQAMFCSTAVTIVSGAVAERIRFSAYLVITLLVSGLLYPLFGHWSWNGLDDGGSSGWLGSLGFVDFAGSTVVHSVGGWVALAAVLIIGPRIGRFSPKRRRLITGYDLPLALLGTLLLWFGWFGFNGGSVLALTDDVPGIIANTLLAGAAGLVFPVLLDLLRQRHVSAKAVMNGSLAGLVAITANCNVVTTGSAILIGGIGSLCMLMTDRLLERHRIDDVVGAIPVHLSPGIWGTLAVGLFGDRTLIDTGLTRPAQVLVQLLGIGVAAAWAFGLTFIVLHHVNRRWPLRVSHRYEHVGLNISEHGATSDLLDLFMVMRRQERTGDLGLRAPVEKFTPVGQIAARYNRVISRLERALARTDAIVATASEAILTVTPQQLQIQSANPAVRKLFGISEHLLCQQSLPYLLDKKALASGDATALSQILRQASNDGCPYEITGYRQGGTTVPLEMIVSRVETRRQWSYAVILRDISLRKQAEEAIQTSEAKDLKARQLEKALHDLQQTQLQLVHTEKLSSLGQLVAGVTHEINNPINFIYGNLHYLKDYTTTLLEAARSQSPQPVSATAQNSASSMTSSRSDPELDYIADDMPKLLASMETGAERITKIVRALQDFSHRGGAQLKQIDIHHGLDSTLTILNSRLKSREYRSDITIMRHYGQLPQIECYPGLLNQVFMNLLVNAIDAVDERAERIHNSASAASVKYVPQITVSTYYAGGGSEANGGHGANGNGPTANGHPSPQGDRLRSDPQYGCVCISITDNGIGFSDAVKQRMLDPFFTTKPAGRGTGLGMSISHRIIVEQHQGQLSCVSTPNEGSRFVVALPVTQMAHKILSEDNGAIRN